MSANMKKLDLKILDTNSDRFRYIKPVTSLDTFQGMSKNFHEDGLFSTSIFGKVGTQDRNLRMSYINIKIKIFNPKIYFLICGYKQLYKNIIAGTAYAKWDPKLKDFVKATNIDGDTGFNFFLQHWEEIRFVKNDSYSQNEAVNVITKYKNIALTSRVMVIPAGIRDVEIDDNGEVTKHEINDFYVKLLSIANSIPDSGDLNTTLTDRARLSLQLTMCELYDYLSTLTGQLKKSFMRRKWGNRRVKYGSRNVITGLPELPARVADERSIKFNETGIGLYHAISVFAPILIHNILNSYAQKYMNPNPGTMNLVEMKSLNRVEVKVKARVIDKWTTPTGLGKLIDGFNNIHLRNKPIIIDGFYLGLVYQNEKGFKLLNDINDLAGKEDQFDKVHPVSYAEFFYIHIFKWISEYPGTVTRYPVNGYRSIYPTYPKLLTTASSLYLAELNENLEPTGVMAPHYPNSHEPEWIDAMIPHQSRLPGLGADFDGDMCNFNPIFSLEARRDVKRYLNSNSAYLNSAGQLLHDPFSETLERVLYSLSGDVK